MQALFCGKARFFFSHACGEEGVSPASLLTVKERNYYRKRRRELRWREEETRREEREYRRGGREGASKWRESGQSSELQW